MNISKKISELKYLNKFLEKQEFHEQSVTQNILSPKISFIWKITWMIWIT